MATADSVPYDLLLYSVRNNGLNSGLNPEFFIDQLIADH